MNTSYFGKYKGNNGVAVSLYVPPYYMGRRCTILAPSESILFSYRQNNDKKEYIRRYTSEILDMLSPYEIYNFLGDNAVLLCYEKTGFCHRLLIAEWLMRNLNIPPITEL